MTKVAINRAEILRDGAAQFVAEFDAGRLRQSDRFQREQRLFSESCRIACEMQLSIFDDEEIGEVRAPWAREPTCCGLPGGACAHAREDGFAELVKLTRAAVVVAH